MLKRFIVTNFKNFGNRTELILDTPSNYEFHEEIVENNCITKCMFYGKNGSGKSNLALALFDIVLHLTDKERAFDKYNWYLNLSGDKACAEFEYLFQFGDDEVSYHYRKSGPLSLLNETLIINGEEVVQYDFIKQEGFTKLKGSETLQLNTGLQIGINGLSRVKYIKSNAILEDNEINKAFAGFIDFVDRMLMFYSLDSNRYQGFSLGVSSYTLGIIEANRIREFQEFLHQQGVDYDLVAMDFNGSNDLFCRFPKQAVRFVDIASTGTKSLALFYYWYISMEQASLVFIDEYDAFYHFELAQELVRLVRSIKNTQVFMSTHNTDLLSNDLLRPDAYYIIENDMIRPLNEKTDKELRRAHNLQKMYKAGSFNG